MLIKLLAWCADAFQKKDQPSERSGVATWGFWRIENFRECSMKLGLLGGPRT